MMKAAVIRWAVPRDWLELGSLQARCYHDAYRGLLPNAFLERVTADGRQTDCRSLLQEHPEHIAMLCIGDRAAGYISLRFSIEALRGEGEITALYLLREYWGRGLGKRMMGWGLERLRERGCAWAGLWVLEKNVNARRFYEGQGFQLDGKERVVMRGDPFIQLRYEKEIG